MAYNSFKTKVHFKNVNSLEIKGITPVLLFSRSSQFAIQQHQKHKPSHPLHCTMYHNLSHEAEDSS